MIQAEQQVGRDASHQEQLFDGIEWTIDRRVWVWKLCVVIAFSSVFPWFIIRIDEIENSIGYVFGHSRQCHE